MKFILEVDLGKIEGDAAAELGRALRYWGGAMKQLDLAAEQRQDIHDSSYQQSIGYWELRAAERDDIAGQQHNLG